MKSRLLFVFGTRPEAIKMAPLVTEATRRAAQFEVRVCVTAQHRAMLDQVLRLFSIVPDFDLDVMRSGQTLCGVAGAAMERLESVIGECCPDLVLVQGDTTTALAGALAGYYCRVPVAHVEAGLRSGNRQAPFPEEVNRTLIGHTADYHFAPTEGAKENLGREGIREHVHVVGNTVIDALLRAVELLQGGAGGRVREQLRTIPGNRRLVLVTGHRRESFGRPMERIAGALREIVQRYDDVVILYPLHMNENVRGPMAAALGSVERVLLVDPIEYHELVWALNRCTLVITDSGGIQEEAPALGKPVLVTRETTERPELVESGAGLLVGMDTERIVDAASRLLTDQTAYQAMARVRWLFGDGHAAGRILDVLAGLPAPGCQTGPARQ